MTKTIVFLILVALVIVFVIQNTQVVEFQFLAWKVSMSRALLLLGTFGMGVVVGWLSRRLRPKVRKAT
jgi:putative membrane protein